MNGLVLALYGIYLIAVGLNGNGNALGEYVSEDAGGYFPWLVAIFVLVLLYEFEATRKITLPFGILLVLNFILQNYGTIENEFRKLAQRAAN